MTKKRKQDLDAKQATIADQREANAQMVQTTLSAQELTERSAAALAQAEATMQALRESEERYRTLFELSPVAVYSCDASGLLESFNSVAAQIWGRQPPLRHPSERFCGSFKLCRPDGSCVPREQSPMAEVLSGKTGDVRDAEMLIERPDGSRVSVVLNIHALKNQHGEVTGAISCAYDISARKNAERALHDAVSVREKVLAIVSHDLRNPLSSIIMSTHALLKVAPTSDRRQAQRKKIEIIERAAQRMHRLVDDLADFASIQSGHLNIKKGAEDPAELLGEAAISFDAIATLEGLTLSTNAPNQFISSVDCDRDRVMQVFSNLLGNAVKVTARGGLITLGAMDRGRDVMFSVTDTGPGIAKSDLNHIFVRYWRGENPRYRGTGLGLAIAQGIVHAHGGKIWVESTVGVGTTFFFSIPTVEVSSQHPDPQTIDTSPEPVRLSPTIMVVDDEPDIREIMTELLEAEGFLVIAVANGKDALAHLHEVGPQPSLILLDLMMPVMDGWTFAAHRDKEPALANIPLVVVSGAHDLQAIALSLHATACMRKPLQGPVLVALAHRLCDTPQQQALH